MYYVWEFDKSCEKRVSRATPNITVSQFPRTQLKIDAKYLFVSLSPYCNPSPSEQMCVGVCKKINAVIEFFFRPLKGEKMCLP